MKKTIISLLVIAMLTLSGCAGIQIGGGPSICDDYAGSQICQSNSNVDFLFKSLQIAHLIALDDEVYSAEEALEFTSKIKSIFTQPVTYGEVLGAIQSTGDGKKVQGILIILEANLSQPMLELPLNEEDRQLIVSQLTVFDNLSTVYLQ